MLEALQLGGIPGGMEMLVILLLAVLLFGANKIPKLARSSGQAIGEFQKGREQVEQELSDIRDSSAEDVVAEDEEEDERFETATSED
jgi:sec-independent protein translocase protein TatA